MDTALASEAKQLATMGQDRRASRTFGLGRNALTLSTGRLRAAFGSTVDSVAARAKVFARPGLVRLRLFFNAPLEEEIRQLRDQIDDMGRYSARVAVATADDVLVRTAVGYVLCASNDYMVLTNLIEGGELERGTRILIEKLVKPGDVIVDVGAHLGLHTLAAAKSLRGTGKVLAFEPFEPTARRLQETVRLNGLQRLVEVHQAAVAGHSERRPLFLGDISGHHSLFPLNDSDRADDSPVEVEVTTLDRALADVPHVALLKIDAEGSELDVVEGGEAVIKRNPEIALIVEFGPSHLDRTGHSVADWFARFEDFGFMYRVIDSETGRLRERSASSLGSVESVNLLFARPDARAWIRASAG
jgi:FkbM family methyltransferase